MKTKDGFDIRVGDVVYLASGGMAMTVGTLDCPAPATGQVGVIWFTEAGELRENTIPSELLVARPEVFMQAAGRN